MRIFVDTGAWLATEIKNDIHHSEAIRYKKKAEKERSQLYVNDYVLAETYTRLIYEVYLKAAFDFDGLVKEGVESGAVVLLEVDSKIRERAWEELERYSDHKLSFTDATIIASFKDYNLDEIFTFDDHFKKCNLPTNPF